MLLMLAGFTMPPMPSPAVSKGEPPAAAMSLKETFSVAAGTPGVRQFYALDQFVFTLPRASTPLHVTEGRTPIGPAVSVSRTEVPSPLWAMALGQAARRERRVPSTKLYPVMPPEVWRSVTVAG